MFKGVKMAVLKFFNLIFEHLNRRCYVKNVSTGKQLRWSTFLIKCLACKLLKQDIIPGVFLWILGTFPGQVFWRAPCDWLINRSTYHQDHHHHLQYPCSVSVLLAWNYRIHYLISLFDWNNFSGKTCIFDLVITWYFQNLERINIQVKQIFSNIQIWSS